MEEEGVIKNINLKEHETSLKKPIMGKNYYSSVLNLLIGLKRFEHYRGIILLYFVHQKKK